MLITVATKEEKEALIPKKYWDRTVVTGIGIMNTIMTLKNMEVDDIVVNVGYAGAKDIPIGTICMVSECEPYQVHDLPQANAPLYEARLGLPSYVCYTATDFIEYSSKPGPFLVDMELVGHIVLKVPTMSIKIVSDDMNMNSYNEALKKEYTEEIESILKTVEVL